MTHPHTFLIITSNPSTPETIMRGIPKDDFISEAVGILPQNPDRLKPGERPLTHQLGDRLRTLLADTLDRFCAIVIESASLTPGPTIYSLAKNFAPRFPRPIVVIARATQAIRERKDGDPGMFSTNSLRPDDMLKRALEAKVRDKHFVVNAADANAIFRAMIRDGTIPRPSNS